VSGSLAVMMPIPTVPVQDQVTGELSQAWYRFFLALWNRSGGAIGTLGVPGGASGNVQFNNNGAFGGLSDAELTARIQVFSPTTSGAVPQSVLGLSSEFLAGDGVFRFATPGGFAGGDLGGAYPNPIVVKAANPTLSGATITGDGSLHFLLQTTDAGAQAGTLTNAPTAGNPTFWLRVTIDGVPLAIPAWPA
jgi:hypothetical protein